MKRLLFYSLGCIFLVTGIRAQDCTMYFPGEENMQLEYKQFDKKGNPAGSSVQKITGITRNAGSVITEVSSEQFDGKGKSLGSVQLQARCENGIYYIDMKNYMNQQSMESYEDMEMTMEGGNLEIPGNLKAGDVLKNGDMKMSFSSGGMTVMNMTVAITNRKVDAVESITTPAGTFECYKISYDIATKMMINIRAKGTEWYSKDVGMVKSESYSSDGKLMGSTVLASVKK